jgi:predicted DNA-binding protein (MmcQ/YjbR family)
MLMPISAAKLQQTARETASALPDVTSGRPFTPTLDVFKVHGKVFLIVTDEDDHRIITVKCDPAEGHALQQEHSSITPGHYLNKRHWISIAAGPGATIGRVRDLVQNSYQLVSAGKGRGRGQSPIVSGSTGRRDSGSVSTTSL